MTGTVPGLGGQQQPSVNAPAGQVLVPGVTPGTSAVFVQLKAGNTIINKNGIFTYSGAPAAGNLIFSDAPASGTDPYGNPYLQGATAYIYFSGQQLAASLSTEIASSPALSFQNMGSAGSVDPAVYGNANSGSGPFNQLVLSSGDDTGAGTISFTLQAQSLGGDAILLGANNFTASGCAVKAQSFTSTGDMSVEGSDLFVGNGTTANIDLSPKMGVPAGYPLAGTATNAQIVACLNQLIGEMENRNMIG